MLLHKPCHRKDVIIQIVKPVIIVQTHAYGKGPHQLPYQLLPNIKAPHSVSTLPGCTRRCERCQSWVACTWASGTRVSGTSSTLCTTPAASMYAERRVMPCLAGATYGGGWAGITDETTSKHAIWVRTYAMIRLAIGRRRACTRIATCASTSTRAALDYAGLQLCWDTITLSITAVQSALGPHKCVEDVRASRGSHRG